MRDLRPIGYYVIARTWFFISSRSFFRAASRVPQAFPPTAPLSPRSAAFAKYTLRKSVYSLHQRFPCTRASLFLLSSEELFRLYDARRKRTVVIPALPFSSPEHVRAREMLHLGSHSPLEFKTDSRQVILPRVLDYLSPTCPPISSFHFPDGEPPCFALLYALFLSSL